MKSKIDISLVLAVALSLASIGVSSAFTAPCAPRASGRSTVSVSRSSLQATPPVSPADVKAVGAAVEASAASVASAPLFTYFATKVIDVAVPAAIVSAVAFFFFSQLKGARGGKGGDDSSETLTAISELYNDLYSSTAGTPGRGGPMNPFAQLRPPPLPKNIGLPEREFLKITNMNERFEAYDFSLTKATESKARAAADFRSKAFDRALGLALNAEPSVEGSTVAEFLAPRVKAKLLQIEKEFLKKGKDKFAELLKVEGKLAAETMDAELAKLGERAAQMNEEDLKVIDAELVNNTDSSETSASFSNGTESNEKNDAKDLAVTSEFQTQLKGMFGKNKKADGTPNKKELIKEVTELQTELKELELDLIQQVLAAVGPKRAIGLRNALLGDSSVRGVGSLLLSLEDRPLSSLLRADDADASRRKSVFVMNFPGDVQASQLNELREEVTGVIRNARPGDEALVVLQSGGGTVTGYGLAAGQLVRLKEKGLRLTIAVEQVAASGGYMMSCVADKIIASPFAVIGSIGVISEIPNVYERLNKEGIQFQTVTAGKFKRTLTPTKKITKEDLAKSKDDIEDIFRLFKGWVEQNRPQLNIDEVATGETWFGPAALEKGLCDEIKTVDDVLLDYISEGCNVYQVKYDPPPEVPGALRAVFASDDRIPRANGNEGSIGRQAVRWLVQSFVEEVKAATTGINETPLEQKYMARDDTQDRVKASSDDSYYY